jgi:hypothetical protein
MSFINTNEIINYVKARLGGSAHRIELDDEAINRLIHEQTLKTISTYFPLQKKVVVTMANRILDPLNRDEYFLPDMDEDVISIAQMIPPTSGFGVYINNNLTYQLNNNIGNTMLDGLGNIIYLATFIPPNRIKVTPILPNNWQWFTLLVNVAHKDFITLTPGLREIVMKLALLDVKIDIYGIRSYFANLNTEFGQIELNLSGLESAISDRDTLIEEIRKKQLFSSTRKKVWRV